MRLIAASLALAVAIGYLLGGRLSSVASLRVRWQPLAIVGLALQVIPVPGRALSLGLLYVSFVLLIAFGLANVAARVPGSLLILIGIALNFTVIGLNQGMPVTRDALVASGQGETLAVLLHDGGAKHHVSGPDDRLLFLGDVLPILPIRMVASPGDLIAYGGVVWLVVSAMLGRFASSRERSVGVAVLPKSIHDIG
ncbi:MAG TPA: DUF5317 family protein [Actinomycetota bacterium]|nr:DUF5317 family protein [Actinomycetota bacterium]